MNHLLGRAVCFFLRIIKVLIFCFPRRVHFASFIAHGDAVADYHDRNDADRQPDIFGIIKEKRITEADERWKSYCHSLLEYESRHDLRC